MFANAFNLPQTKNGIVHFPGCPRQYRADCKAGIFKIGETEMLGNSLQMEILAYRTFNAELFNYPYQQWVEVFFIDKDNTVSNILFKTESIGNFLELITSLTVAKLPLGSQIVTAKTSKRSSDNGNYYAVEFSYVDNQADRAAELCDFITNNINEIYAARLAHTFDKPNPSQQLPAQTEPKPINEVSPENLEI